MDQARNHPLYPTDREHIDRLSVQNPPEDIDLVDLSRIIIRYQDFEGADDLKVDMQKIMKKWNLNRDELEIKTREIWSNGFRPISSPIAESVGSGFDTSDNTSD